MQILVDLIEKDHHGISLRIIDYLCTNYAKNFDVVYYLGTKRSCPFNLYLQYRAQLKAYSKMQFDPFRRHERITISVPSTLLSRGTLQTTVAQLNFFKWAIDNKVIDYLKKNENMKRVEEHMNTVSSSKKMRQKTSIQPTKIERTSSCAKRHNIKVTVTFE